MELPNIKLPIKTIVIIASAIVALIILWPFYSVPTGSRGVVTQFGKIVGIERVTAFQDAVSPPKN